MGNTSTVAELLEALGVHQEDDHPGITRRLIHAARGCRPVPEFAVSGDRLVEIGRVCPVCLAEYPLCDRSPGVRS